MKRAKQGIRFIQILAVCLMGVIGPVLAQGTEPPADAAATTTAPPAAETPPGAAPKTDAKPSKKKLWANTKSSKEAEAEKDGAPTEEKKLWANSKAAKAKGTAVFVDLFDKGTIDPQWQLMRLNFANEEGRLTVKPEIKSGFDYGPEKSGRSAAAFTHIGDTGWRNYRFEMDVFGGEADKLGAYEMDPCLRGGFSIYFRTATYPEKWQQPARTAYALALNPNQQLCEGKDLPDAALYRVNDWFVSSSKKICRFTKEMMTTQAGFSPAVTQNVETIWGELLKKGFVEKNGRITNLILKTKGPDYMGINFKSNRDAGVMYQALKSAHCLVPGEIKRLKSADPKPWRVDEPNHVVIEVRGTIITAQVNGVTVLQYNDTSAYAIPYGGIGVEWAWDSVGWIDNVAVTKY